MVAPRPHTTQRRFLIGLSPKNELFIGHNADVDNSVPIQFLPRRFSPWALLTHIYIYVPHLTLCGRIFKHAILKVQYNKKRNTKTKEHAKLLELCDTGRCDFPGSPRLHMIDLEFLNQNILHRLIITELCKN